MIKGYACRSKKSETVVIAAPSKGSTHQLPEIKEKTGWFWHCPGWFLSMSVRGFKKAFGFSIKPGTYKLINISISER